MKASEQSRYNSLYHQHLRALKLQGMSVKTIDAYARALRRVAGYFNRCPDHLSTEQLACYFSDLVDSHSWSTVKVDRNGLQFFYKHVLKRDWTWVEIIKPPKIQSLPDILTLEEIGRLISATRKLRYRVFLLTTYSCWDFVSASPLRYRWAISMAGANRYMYAAAKAARIDSCRCPISLTGHCAVCGPGIAIRNGYSRIRSELPSVSPRRADLWIVAVPRPR